MNLEGQLGAQRSKDLRWQGFHFGRCLQGEVSSPRMVAMVSSHLGLITVKTKGKKGLKLLLFGPMIGCATNKVSGR